MRRRGLLIALGAWVRAYLVALLLVFVFGLAVVRTFGGAVCPQPQHPPQGYVLSQTRTELQWGTGNRPGELRLQVALKETFAEPIVDEVVERTVYDLTRLEPGRTYYWRIIVGECCAATASFTVAPNALRFL